MRLRPERRLAVLLALLLALPLAAVPAPVLERAPLSAAEIDAAVLLARSDPNLGIETKTRKLHWVTDGKPTKPAEPRPWLLGFFQFLGEAARLLMWIFGFIAVGLLGVWIYRMFGTRVPRVAGPVNTARASVGDLDIRPTSLPADIGAAARALLDAGQTRAALALLYRGALSRAVHRHGVAIGTAATEAEVLRTVNGRLDASGVDYFRTLVPLWQSTVYAGVPAEPEAVRPLCAGFIGALG